MGTYATTTSLGILMIGTTFDTATSALATKVITQAENEVNKYLSKRYDVGDWAAGSVPPLVTSLTENLAVGYMYRNMSRGSKEGLARAKSYIDDVISNLKLISEYKGNVTDTSGSNIPDSADSGYAAESTTQDYENTFNEDDQLNWRVDPNKLDDIDSERD